MPLPAHSTKLGDRVRICTPDFWMPGLQYEGKPYISPESYPVVIVTAYDIVVQAGPWKIPARAWVKVRT